MIYLRSHTIHTRKGGKGRRGSVIVLVVAVLALLAVIGTVYIVSARSERGGATASEGAVNLDNAQKSVNDMVTQAIGDSILDSSGYIGGTTALGPLGTHSSRRFDMPEGNPGALVLGDITNRLTWNIVAPNGPFTSSYNPLLRDQSWLVDSVYRFNANVFNPYAGIYPAPGPAADVRYKSVSLLTPGMFDPTTGLYDIPVYGAGPGFFPNFTSLNMFSAVADPSILPPLRMPTSTGAGVGITNADADSYINLLPFSDASGVRYRFGVRIIDASALANLNVGMSNATVTSPFGTYSNDYWLDSPSIFTSAANFAPVDQAANLLNARLGGWAPSFVAGTPTEYVWNFGALRMDNPFTLRTAPFDLADELELRSYGAYGTLAIPRSASGNLAAPLWPNTLGNRNPNSANVVGNPNRNFYTAYSNSRALRVGADPPADTNGIPTAYRVAPTAGWAVPPPTGTTSDYVWPPFPASVAAMPDISGYTPGNAAFDADRLAVAVTNIGTVMDKIAGYTSDEARAFAADYLTFRWNTWQLKDTQTYQGHTINVYTLPSGPSYIDATGPVLRNGVTPGNYAAVTAGTSALAATGKVYLGYAAQPFINEVAVSYHYVAASNTFSADDGAVELYNPYDVALSLDDYQLTVNGTVISFAGKDYWIPPRGYFVLTQNTPGLDQRITNADAQKHVDATLNTGAGGDVILQRKYLSRTNAQQWGAIDRFGAANLNVTAMTVPAVPPADGSAEVDFVARPNNDDGTKNTDLSRWAGTVHDPVSYEVKQVDYTSVITSGTGTLTLGSANASTNAVTKYIPLYDRVIELYNNVAGSYTSDTYTPTFALAAQRQIPTNIADFDRIMRVSSEFDGASGGPAGNGAISQQLFKKIITPDPLVAGTDFPPEASVRFDFRDTLATVSQGDPRATTLLNSLAFTDRVSDYSIDLGDNDVSNRGISKLRIPGQINVNTAPPEVLYAIPELYTMPGLIGAILAYRWRTNTADPRIPVAMAAGAGIVDLQTTGGGLTDFSTVPGYGIRDMGELEVAVTAYLAKNPSLYGATPYFGAPTTLCDREKPWGNIFNQLTTRSDTFVMYGYLEAVRQNPRYNNNPVAHLNRANDGNFDNSTDWYLNVVNTTAVPTGAITDDPNNPNAPLLRLARRRWVAIVDRSNANFSRYTVIAGSPPPLVLDSRFTQPRIIAAKDLPQ